MPIEHVREQPSRLLLGRPVRPFGWHAGQQLGANILDALRASIDFVRWLRLLGRWARNHNTARDLRGSNALQPVP